MYAACYIAIRMVASVFEMSIGVRLYYMGHSEEASPFFPFIFGKEHYHRSAECNVGFQGMISARRKRRMWKSAEVIPP